MQKYRLLIFAHDAASANVTIAYASLNKHKYSSILAFPKGPANAIYKQNIEQYISTNKVSMLHTDTVVTGTSGIHSTFELETIIQAKNNNVQKTIMLLDSTSNFNLRFSINKQLIQKKYTPDEIWVFEENFKSNIDYIDAHIFLKEDIYHHYLLKKFTNNPPPLKNKNIIKYKDKYITIITEYISELYGNKYGFNEFDFLENIFSCIEKFDFDIPIFLKLHPVEDNSKYNQILSKYKHLNILKEDFDIHELIYYTKIVLGMSSSVFKESRLLDKPTYSIQIGATLEMETLLDKKYHINTTQDLQDLIWYNSCYS